MNTKKQKVVKKISERYSESAKNGVLVCKSKNLNARELTALKRKIWEVGDTSFLKNTLFYQVIKSRIENDNQMNGSHFAVFSNKDKDIFQVMSALSGGVKGLALSKKVSPMCIFLEDTCYVSTKDLQMFQSFESKESLQVSICMTIMVIPIKICKILQQLAAKQRE